MKPTLSKAAQQLREQFDDTFADRLAAKSGEKRISYVIFNGRIASSRLGWRWRKYTGSNPHNHHCHISFTNKGDEDGSFFNIPLLGATK